MKKLKKAGGLICALLMAAVLFCGPAVTVSAESIFDLIIAATKEIVKNDINTSTVSSSHIMLGETVILKSGVKGYKAKDCLYTFSVKLNKDWVKLKEKTDQTGFRWTPRHKGDYQICIEVWYGRIVGRKYFKLRVSEPLVNESYAGTSFIQLGNTMTLRAHSQGGFGTIKYTYLYRRKDQDDWTVLSEPSTADLITWRPQTAGEYELCIRAEDDDAQQEDRLYDLTVSEPLTKTPAEFIITVRSPVSSPYFWQCELSDDSVLEQYAVKKPDVVEGLRTYAVMEYHFRTVSAGSVQLCMIYDTYSEKCYTLSYDIIVDRNLNYSVNAVQGEDPEGLQPQPEQQKNTFEISVPKSERGFVWQCEVSDDLIITQVPGRGRDDEYVTFRFEVMREGHATVSLTCTDSPGISERYKLIYNICADRERNVTVKDTAGIYAENEVFPEMTLVE